MKKIIVFTLTLFMLINSFAQEKPAISAEKNVLKINTLSLIVGTGSVFYERKISDMISGQLGLAYLKYKFSNVTFAGLILTPEVRIHPKRDAIDGFYIGPYLRYQNYSLEYKPESAKGTLTSIGGGVLLGRQWITDSGFTMDLFFGAHYASASAKATSGTHNFDDKLFEGFSMRMGFALGFAF